MAGRKRKALWPGRPSNASLGWLPSLGFVRGEVWDVGKCALLATRPRDVVAFESVLLFAEPKPSVCCDLPPRCGARCVADVVLRVQSWVELARMPGSNFVWLGFLLFPPCHASPGEEVPTGSTGLRGCVCSSGGSRTSPGQFSLAVVNACSSPPSFPQVSSEF